MNVNIRNFNEKKDAENFYWNSFETLISMKGIPPGLTQTEYYNLLIPEFKAYINALEENHIFVAEGENSQYLGHIWLSLTEELDPWEMNHYFWLHNITIPRNYRNLGIGSQMMHFLERYIMQHNVGMKKIGLHVNAENENALKLYQKMQYSTYKTQIFYKIQEISICEGSTYEIRPAISDPDFQSILAIAMYFNLSKLTVDKSVDLLQKNFEDIFNVTKKKEEDIAYILKNEDDVTVGYFILKESEMKFHKTAYITQFGFNTHSRLDRLIDSILQFTENWAKEKNIDKIESIVYIDNRDILEYLKTKGFEEFGYFKRKNIEV